MRNRLTVQGQLTNRLLLVLGVIVALSTGTFAETANITKSSQTGTVGAPVKKTKSSQTGTAAAPAIRTKSSQTGSVAGPVKKTRAAQTGSVPEPVKIPVTAIHQVKSDLRSIAEASVLWEKTGNCSKHECTDVDKLMSAGTLTVEPDVPPGLGNGDPAPLYNATERREGGCGSLTPGAPRHIHPALYYVSEKFCRMYNESVGLGNSIIENCGSGGNCAASGSADLYDFPVINSSSFCYRRKDSFAIVWKSTVTGAPCPQQ